MRSNSNMFGLLTFLLVVILGFAAWAQEPTQYITFQPLVIEGTAKVERCTVCTFNRPLVIVGRVQRKLTRNEKRALADALAPITEAVAAVTAPMPIANKK